MFPIKPLSKTKLSLIAALSLTLIVPASTVFAALTFNATNITSDGALNLSAAAASIFTLPSSSTTALNIQSGLMDFDTTNSRVGIGTITPAGLLDISGARSAAPSATIGNYLSLSSSILTDNATASSGTATGATFNSLAQDTLSATNTLITTTNAYGLYLAGAPTAGTNETLTNTTALNIAAGTVASTTNSYGMRVNAQTGATNNYAASFMGGNVGIGTIVPSTLFSVGTGATSNFTVDSSGNTTTNGTINANGGTIATSQTTANLLNATATTINVGGAATTLAIGAATGTATINNATINFANGVLQTAGTTRISNAGVGTFITGTTIGSQTFTTNNIADSGSLTIASAAASNLTLNSGTTGIASFDSGTTGIVNLGTGNNAKTINIGTGTAGDIINIGTNNTVADTIGIGSALDTLTFRGTASFNNALTANTFSSSGVTITGGTINGTTIGATTAGTGAFTTLTASGTTTLQNTYFSNMVTASSYGGFAGASSNVFTYSSFEESNALSGWTFSSYIETAERSATYAIDGSYSLHLVDVVIPFSGGLSAYSDVTGATSAGAQYTLSFFVRGGSGNISPAYSDSVGGTHIGSSITLSSSWQQITYTFTFSGGSTQRWIGVSIGGTEAYVDAMQLEAGSSATPYIPTGASTLARTSGFSNAQNFTAYRNAYFGLYGGNVGVGTSSPTTLFSTLGTISSATTNAIATITNNNTSDSANTIALRINLGTATTTTNSRYATFYANVSSGDTGGTREGSIQSTNGGVAYNTGAADFAERFSITQPTQPGDVIGITDRGITSKATLHSRLLGVVSNTAGFIGNNNDAMNLETNPVVGLLGQINTNVSTENGPIRTGDYLTSSSIPGIAMKATAPGDTIGKALASFDCSPNTNSHPCTGKILVFVHPGFADPTGILSLTSDGNLAGTSLLSSFSFPTPSLTLDSAAQALQTSLQNLGPALQDGVLRVRGIVAERITGDTLCAGNTCVDQDQLQQLLQNQQQFLQDHQQLQQLLQKQSALQAPKK